MKSIRASTVSLVALAIGAPAVVLVAAPYKIFDLDRYFVPKELALHLTALVAVVAALLSADPAGSWRPKLRLTRTDTLLLAFLGLTLVSASVAPNRWLAARALAVSASGISLFWVGQYLARNGRAGSLMTLLAAAVTAAAVTTLLQAYGVESEFFSINRSPGGTLGNRNFVAHIAVIGAPTLLLATVRTRKAVGVIFGAVAAALVAAAIVLSRSRAAWLAIALASLSILPIVIRLWRDAHQSGPAEGSGSRATPRPPAGAPTGSRVILLRATIVGLAAVAGVCAAITLPNTLNWRSASPYLDSVLGVTNYRGGSGHGRIVQDLNTGRLVVSHPLLGVGPGNWAVVYPRVASRNDPSLDPDDGMTANPWPSSDWAAFLSERGAIATACLALAFLGLLVGGWHAAELAVESGSIDRALPALALIATVVALVIVEAFNAVLLLPAPSLLAWTILGTLAGMLTTAPTTRVSVPWTFATQAALVVIVTLAAGLAVARSTAQVAAMALYTSATATGGSERRLELAAQIDPSSYRIRIRLAEAYAQGRLCSRMRPQATAARSLYPSAPEPRRLLATCSRGGH